MESYEEYIISNESSSKSSSKNSTKYFADITTTNQFKEIKKKSVFKCYYNFNPIY